MADLATLQLRLTEAENALHRLSIGKAVVSISDGERKLTFTSTNINALRNYIDALRQQIADLLNPYRARRGPVVFTF